MKNKILLAALAAAALLAFAGCSASNTSASSSAGSAPAAESAVQTEDSAMADGVYTAEMDDASAEAAYGWRDRLVVEYKDGEMVSAVFESYDADGNKKSETSTDVYPMDPAPADWMLVLSENILAAAGSTEFDGVSGATLATGNARAMMQAILDSGVADETIVVAQVSAAE